MVNLQTTNGQTVFNTMQPSFYINYDNPATVALGIQITDDPAWGSVIYSSDSISDPDEWPNGITTNRTILYRLPFGVIDEGQTYYVRAISYFGGPPPEVSKVLTIQIQGAVYPIRFVAGLIEQIVIPKRNGFITSETITGCLQVNKKIITIDFTPLTKDQRDILYNDFFLHLDPWGVIDGRFFIYDQQNIQTIVYWGEVQRNIKGEAIRPNNPIFGIKLRNMKTGMVRYDGKVTFSEV